jgi:mannose-6-phosphate isomerase-like protein (cupin superfamily)
MTGYTITALTDVPDVLGDYPGEMHMLTSALGNEQVALTYRRMPQHTGGKGGYGHRHLACEEIYFVFAGKLQFKLDEEVVELPAGTAVRVGAEVVRSVWNDEPEDGVLMIISRFDDPPDEAIIVENFWPED